MAKFRRNEPVETKEPFVKVENLLEPGIYRFQLVVVNDKGKQSPPAEQEVRIVKARPA